MVAALLISAIVVAGHPSKPIRPVHADTAQYIDYLKKVEDARRKLDLEDYPRAKEYRYLREWDMHEGKLTPTFYCSELWSHDWC